MKKPFFLLLILVSFSVKSQELELILLAKDDANLLIKNYMTPIMEGMSYNLNNGWNHTAKTHKKLGFNISFNANITFVPNNKKSFIFNESDYQYLSLENGNSKINTVMGGNNSSEIGIRIPEATNYKVAQFKMPDGIGNDVNFVPSAMLQASVGIPFSTNISFRILPTVNTDDVTASLVGFGIKHNLMQYFGPLDKLPLNIALFGGYTTMNATYNLQNIDGLPGNNQETKTTFKSYTFQALASLDFPILSLYGAIGYDKGSSNLKMNGTYELTYTMEGTNSSISESITNPINLDFNVNSITSTLGVKLNLGFFKIYGDYTIKEYNSVTAGIAFSFR
jgi:hypothetical protein